MNAAPEKEIGTEEADLADIPDRPEHELLFLPVGTKADILGGDAADAAVHPQLLVDLFVDLRRSDMGQSAGGHQAAAHGVEPADVMGIEKSGRDRTGRALPVQRDAVERGVVDIEGAVLQQGEGKARPRLELESAQAALAAVHQLDRANGGNLSDVADMAEQLLACIGTTE
ncbi:MAG: hypothetical protein BWY77_00456 [bacterium ADurb.Bin431]|nr:MAG: hypothetical protein BWY77_00456 [bacterium ADurb.Bin431]